MKKRATIPMAGVLAGVGFTLVCGEHPQSAASPTPRIELQAGDTVSIANSGFSMATIGPVRCDSQGYVYLRPTPTKGTCCYHRFSASHRMASI